jgi:putative modified peptide
MSNKDYEDLPAAMADRLLDALGSDDAFRAAFVADPRGALASLGYAPAADSLVASGIWESLKVERLAEKSAFRDARAQLRNDVLNARVVADPVSLDQAR